MVTNSKRQALRAPAFVLGLALTVSACNSSSGSPTPPAPTATTQTNASTSGLSTGSSSDSSSIFGGSSSDTPQSIRSEQVTELKSEISRYENQLEYALSDRDGMLSQTLPSVEQRIIPAANTPTLLGGAVTGIGDIATGGVLTGLGTATTGGDNGNTVIPGNSAASGAGGDFSAGFGAIGNGISAAQQTAAIQQTVTQITANVQGEIDQLNAEIKDLQTKIASLEQQVDALIAQGT